MNTERLLEIFVEYEVRATFFVLGWVAERFPKLVDRIASLGHEVASHGYGHRLVYDQTPRTFREDVRRAKALLEAASGLPVDGYRAPSYSITPRSLWALDILIEEGYTYDSSIFPIRHDRYGIPLSPRHPYVLQRPAGATSASCRTNGLAGASTESTAGKSARPSSICTRGRSTPINRDFGRTSSDASAITGISTKPNRDCGACSEISGFQPCGRFCGPCRRPRRRSSQPSRSLTYGDPTAVSSRGPATC